jgi:hypothetical protein
VDASEGQFFIEISESPHQTDILAKEFPKRREIASVDRGKRSKSGEDHT